MAAENEVGSVRGAREATPFFRMGNVRDVAGVHRIGLVSLAVGFRRNLLRKGKT